MRINTKSPDKKAKDAKAIVDSKSHLDLVSSDIETQIASFLDAKSLTRFGLANKQRNALSLNESFWKPFLTKLTKQIKIAEDPELKVLQSLMKIKQIYGICERVKNFHYFNEQHEFLNKKVKVIKCIMLTVVPDKPELFNKAITRFNQSKEEIIINAYLAFLSAFTDKKKIAQYLRQEIGATLLGDPNILIAAIYLKDLELVKFLIDDVGLDLKTFCEKPKERIGKPPLRAAKPPLYYAAKIGDVAITKYLIEEKGERPIRQYEFGPDIIEYYPNDNALFVAARHGHLPLCRYLIEEIMPAELRIDPNQTVSNGESVIHQAARSGNLELVKYLIEEAKPCIKNPHVTSGMQTTLYYAAISGNFELFKYLAEGFPFDSTICIYGVTLDALVVALCAAVSVGALDIVKYLIEKKGANPIGSDYNGTVLKHACGSRGSSKEVVEYLFEKAGAKLTRTSENDDSVLSDSLDNNKLEITRYLIDTKRMDPQYKGLRTNTTLLYHARTFEAAKYLVEEAGIDPNHVNKNGETALEHIVKIPRTLEVIEYLVGVTKCDLQALYRKYREEGSCNDEETEKFFKKKLNIEPESTESTALVTMEKAHQTV